MHEQLSDAENVERERRIMLLVWSVTVLVIAVLAVGFGGALEAVFTKDDPLIWLLAISPSVPLLLWLKAVRTLKRVSRG